MSTIIRSLQYDIRYIHIFRQKYKCQWIFDYKFKSKREDWEYIDKVVIFTHIFEGNHPQKHIAWWRHQMETFSALLAFGAGNSPFSGEFPSQRPGTLSFDVSLIFALNKRLSKQSWGWLFEMPQRSLWRHCNDSLHNCCAVTAPTFIWWRWHAKLLDKELACTLTSAKLRASYIVFHPIYSCCVYLPFFVVKSKE